MATTPDVDKAFTGSIAELYETALVPLIFRPYADDLARRVAALAPARILEVAAGTGAVTRALRAQLPATTGIVATDLNQAMLDVAARAKGAEGVTWQQADAMALPFADASFDAVVCQFGAMFFPDRGHAFGEARRVLRAGDAFLFNVWDRIADNELADVVTAALATMFPDDPPRFMSRTPHGYHDVERIRADLAAGGFTAPARIDTVGARSRAASARDAALAYCSGTPLRSEIEARGPGRLAEAIERCTAAIEQRFGAGPIDARIQALVVQVAR